LTGKAHLLISCGATLWIIPSGKGKRANGAAGKLQLHMERSNMDSKKK